MELVIDRSRWGVGDDGGLLLDSRSGRMCCLGFMCLQLGFDENEIKSYGMPDALNDMVMDTRFDNEAGRLIVRPYTEKDEEWMNTTEFATAAADINDNKDPDLTLAQREAMLINLFAQQGITLSFTGEYGKVTRTKEAQITDAEIDAALGN